MERNIKNKGFTLIELIVVMAVFLFVIGAAITIFISVVQNQKIILSEQQIANQLSYMQEYMSKSLRMAKKDLTGSCLGEDMVGYVYLLTRPDSVSGFYRGIKFINQLDNDACQEFYLDNTTGPGGSGDVFSTATVLKVLKNSNDDLDAVPISSENMKINSARFGINGTDGSIASTPKPNGINPGAADSDYEQPKVTILINVASKPESLNVNRIIQATVSQRDLNVR